MTPGAVAATRPRREAIIRPPPAGADARERVRVADGDRERVGRVVGRRAAGRAGAIAATIRCTWVLSARPNPHTVFFTSAGGYPAASSPARPQAVEHRAAGVADREDRARVAADEEILQRDRVRLVAAIEEPAIGVDVREPQLERVAGPDVVMTPWSSARIRLPCTAMTP